MPLAKEQGGLLTRRELLRRAIALCVELAGASTLGACGQRVVEIERVIEKEITRVVREIVRETVIVRGTPQLVVVEQTPHVIEKTVEVEKIVTASPAPRPGVTIIADVMDCGWTRFAMLMSPAFEDLFPNIKMRWRSLSGWHEYPQRVETLHASGELGDLLEAPPGVLPTRWAENQVIQPIDSIIAADGFDTSGIFKGIIDAYRHHSKHAGLPFIGHAGENVLLYNKRLFDQAGVPYPSADWTLDDLREAALALTKDQDGDGKTDQFGYAIRYALPAAYPALHLFGATLFSQDGRRCLVGDRSGIASLQWAYDQIHRHRLAPTPAQVERGPLEMLRTGRLAMVRHAFASLVHLAPVANEEGEIGAALIPKHPSTGKLGTLASGMAYCITQRTEQASEAFQWAKFMSSREMGVQMFLGGYGDPGCRLASWKDPRILQLYPICGQIADAANAAEAERLPGNLRVAECFDVWNNEMAALLSGEVTPNDWAAKVAKDIEQVLALPPRAETAAEFGQRAFAAGTALL
ncbi:MAG TPA: extracellular solute-binding protein [Anaerolineae bacterium]|nr:extracellular solute-binding protein [Anaerolineae bacterium]